MTDTKPTKQIYRIRNWADYNAALIQRGSFTKCASMAMASRGPGASSRWQSEVSWFKRGLRRLMRGLQNDLPLPAFHEVLRN